jgi:hypothetical protein
MVRTQTAHRTPTRKAQLWPCATSEKECLLLQVKEWIVCEDNCLKCSYGATLDCDGDCPRCPRNTYCPCVTFVSFAAGKLAPPAQPVTATFDRPRKR